MKKKHIIHSAALLLGLCLAGCKESLPDNFGAIEGLSLIHISEPTRP